MLALVLLLSPAAHAGLKLADRDGDGVSNRDDQCVDDPEDFDGFQDDDGCPDPDNDDDGVLDTDDRCPDEPEEKDGFQDDDGCPDPDNDGDGVPDATDMCPNDPEDFDGFEDGDGCPDPDNDGDTVRDATDKCPNDPETVNGFEDDDGCPDRTMASTLLDWSAGQAKPASAATKPVATAPVAPAPVATKPAAVTPAPVVSGPSLPSIDAPARTGAKASHDTAVVIGLEDYPFLGAGVPYAHRDAQAFGDVLVYTRGVPMAHIQTLSSGAREQIVDAIDRAATEAGRGGTVWVYFAGHGAANPQNGERMLLGDDVRAQVTSFATRGVGVSEIEKLVTAKGARPVLVLDTCYAGASRSGASILGGTRLVVPSYALTDQVTSGAQWNAAAPDQISGPLPGVEHGAFTYFAVGALRGWADGELDGRRDGDVTAAEAEAYVTRMLRRSGTNTQTPVYVGPDDLVLATNVTEVGPGQ
jgi:hypothetical protein